MANRHKAQFKRGGGVFYAGGKSKVAEEAESTENKKEGGRVHGKGGKKRLDKRARGGGLGESPRMPKNNENEVGGGPEDDEDLSNLERANDKMLPKGEHREIPDFPIIRGPLPSRGDKLQSDRKKGGRVCR
jgi:hypothetical protein